MHVWVEGCVCVYICIYVYMSIYVHVCVYMCIYECLCMYVHTSVCVPVTLSLSCAGDQNPGVCAITAKPRTGYAISPAPEDGGLVYSCKCAGVVLLGCVVNVSVILLETVRLFSKTRPILQPYKQCRKFLRHVLYHLCFRHPIEV